MRLVGWCEGQWAEDEIAAVEGGGGGSLAEGGARGEGVEVGVEGAGK